MKWQLGRRSENVEDRRGMGAVGMGGLGLGGVIIVTVISLLLGKNPADVLSQVAGPPAEQAQPGAPPVDDQASQFVGNVLGSTEDVWGKVFQQSGRTYPPPHLVLFSNAVASACGRASAAVGPFYCPNDQKVYLDTSFFEEMRSKLGGGGDFAEAYVIAHEVGHHIQVLTGVAGKVDALRARGASMEGDTGLSVRMELQADCYAGVWANAAQQQNKWLEQGDVEQALNTASAIGDDRLQRQSQGTVVPDSFTHGSSEQRVRWFRSGFDSGDAARCDTFNTRQL
ncbi:MAG: neutral zinc metallopeptidase [Arenimonas sp.]